VGYKAGRRMDGNGNAVSGMNPSLAELQAQPLGQTGQFDPWSTSITNFTKVVLGDLSENPKFSRLYYRLVKVDKHDLRKIVECGPAGSIHEVRTKTIRVRAFRSYFYYKKVLEVEDNEDTED
jgi:hypothetical protein